MGGGGGGGGGFLINSRLGKLILHMETPKLQATMLTKDGEEVMGARMI